MNLRSILVALLLALLVAACGGAGGDRVLQTYLSANEDALYLPASVDNSPVRFVVEPGTPARTIGRQLVEAGLITDDLLFEAYVRVNGLASALEAGTFILNPSMTMVEIAEILQDAESSSVTITIPEGWRLEQQAEYLAEAEILDEEQAAAYLNQALTGDLTGLDPSRYPFLQERPAGTSLEGYLFPDTYRFVKGTKPHDIISRMLDNFDRQLTPELRAQADAQKRTIHQVVTLASIVEREAQKAEERATVAGVYVNRLDREMPLQADPTVQYGIGKPDNWWPKDATLANGLRQPGPFNTYLSPGLPPAPIANPGLASLKAAVQPEKHEFLYFVAKGDGSHAFAKTLDEHNANVRRFSQ